jgi:nicotinate-nucleotide adenylyltransferase
MKKRVGILGGTFDPPHIAHLIIANEVRVALSLSQIIFLPNFIPPHKEASSTKAIDRIEMLKLAICDNPFFALDERELTRSGKSFTYDTMKEMVEENPDIDYYFIIGGDMVEYLPNWYKIDQLMDLVQFVGVNRPKYDLKTPYPVLNVEVPEMSVSSSLLRERVAQKKPIDYLLPKEVVSYVKEHQLYET